MRVFVIYYNNEKAHHPHRTNPRSVDFTAFSRVLFSYSGHFQGKIIQICIQHVYNLYTTCIQNGNIGKVRQGKARQGNTCSRVKSKQGDFLQSFIFCFPFLFSNMYIYLPGDPTVIMTEAARDLFKRDTLFGQQ